MYNKVIISLITFLLVGAQANSQDSDGLSKKIDNLQKSLETFYESVNKKIEKLDKKFTKIKPPEITEVKYNPPQLQYAKIKLINVHTEAYSITVNNQTYRIKPNQTIIVDFIMPGRFTYKIEGITDMRTRQINPNETYTITIYTEGTTPPSNR